MEDRHHHAPVVVVRDRSLAGIRIVPDEDVAFVDVALELLDDRGDVGAELADDHLAALVADHREFVVLLADDRRQRDAHDDAVHFKAGVFQRVFDDVERDGIDLDGHGAQFPLRDGPDQKIAVTVDFGGVPRQQDGGRVVLADDRRAGDPRADGELGAIIVGRLDPRATEITWPHLHQRLGEIGLALLRRRLPRRWAWRPWRRRAERQARREHGSGRRKAAHGWRGTGRGFRRSAPDSATSSAGTSMVTSKPCCS